MTRVCWVDWDARGSWDQQIILDLTAGSEFVHQPREALDAGDGAVVVIPGQHYTHAANWFAERIAALPWALTIVTSDEEALFPVDLLLRDEKHVVWTQYHDRGMDRVIPIGCPPGTAEVLASCGEELPRHNAVFFAGQDTHERRHELLDVMKDMACDVKRYGDIGWAATTGFREGLSQDRYLDALSNTKIAPCPSGPHSLDSFRLYEALAAGCIPLVESHTPHGREGEFWVELFGWPRALRVIDSWEYLPSIVEEYADPELWGFDRHQVQAWWGTYQASLRVDFEMTLRRLSGMTTNWRDTPAGRAFPGG